MYSIHLVCYYVCANALLVVVGHSGSALVSINEVTLCSVLLVLG